MSRYALPPLRAPSRALAGAVAGASPYWLPYGLGLGGLIGLGLLLSLSKRARRAAGDVIVATEEAIVTALRTVYSPAGRVVFASLLPARSQPYADMLIHAGDVTGLSPFVLWALLERESRSGMLLRPPGPEGTGDFTPRDWQAAAGQSRSRSYPILLSEIPFRSRGRDGFGVLPADGLGWGRGLMQIDAADSDNLGFISTGEWKDPARNILFGAQRLLTKMRFLAGKGRVGKLTDGARVTLDAASAARRGVAPGIYPDPRPLTGAALARAAIAAYNAGEGAVLRSVAAGLDPDTTTAAGPSGAPDYSKDVLARSADLEGKYTKASA